MEEPATKKPAGGPFTLTYPPLLLRPPPPVVTAPGATSWPAHTAANRDRHLKRCRRPPVVRIVPTALLIAQRPLPGAPKGAA
eukprot:6191746-Pleurochrysis_carterae.AAC.2